MQRVVLSLVVLLALSSSLSSAQWCSRLQIWRMESCVKNKAREIEEAYGGSDPPADLQQVGPHATVM